MRRRSGTILACCATLLLASCAARPAVRSVAAVPEQIAAPKGIIVSGVVVAMRPVTPQGPLQASSAAVLSALQVAAPAQVPNATEFVIQRSDGNFASIVVRSPAANPGASLSAANFSIGDQVELITGAQTELIHSNP